jgi:hypothetical protein
VTDLRPPVVGAHDYVPRPRVRWTAASAGLRGHTGPICVSRPPVQAAAIAAADVVPASHPGPRMKPLAQQQLGPAVAGQLFQLHGAPPPPTLVQDWVVDSGVMHHTTSSVGNISTLRPLASSHPSSIIVGNDSSLLITSVGDSVLLRPFYLNNILLAPDIVQSLLSVHRFTTDNW